MSLLYTPSVDQSWGYQDPFANLNPPTDNSAAEAQQYFYNIPS
jgi:hypothetical protein